MFKDYYLILEIGEAASQEEIKAAFKQQALIWHPDRNTGIDTTLRMQEINEAYLILKDKEARERYNVEYQSFKYYQRKHEQTSQSEQRQSEYQHNSEQNQKQKEKKYEYSDYKVHDDILRKWMDNAKKQAVELAQQTIQDLKGMVKAGTKAAVKEAGNMLIAQIAVGVIILIIIGLVKACSSN